MNSIIKGTTPTMQWSFSTVPVDSIATAYMTIKRGVKTIISKSLSDATIDSQAKTISWTLSQEETLSLADRKDYSVHLDWKLADGTRGAGVTVSVEMLPAGKNEVI